MIVRYSLVTLCLISDWLLPVDVGKLLLSEPCKYLGVSLCNFVHRCSEYSCSAFSAQQLVSEFDCGIWGYCESFGLIDH